MPRKLKIRAIMLAIFMSLTACFAFIKPQTIQAEDPVEYRIIIKNQIPGLAEANVLGAQYLLEKANSTGTFDGNPSRINTDSSYNYLSFGRCTITTLDNGNYSDALDQFSNKLGYTTLTLQAGTYKLTIQKAPLGYLQPQLSDGSGTSGDNYSIILTLPVQNPAAGENPNEIVLTPKAIVDETPCSISLSDFVQDASSGNPYNAPVTPDGGYRYQLVRVLDLYGGEQYVPGGNPGEVTDVSGYDTPMVINGSDVLTSDSDGKLTITGLPAGHYELRSLDAPPDNSMGGEDRITVPIDRYGTNGDISESNVHDVTVAKVHDASEKLKNHYYIGVYKNGQIDYRKHESLQDALEIQNGDIVGYKIEINDNSEPQYWGSGSYGAKAGQGLTSQNNLSHAAPAAFNHKKIADKSGKAQVSSNVRAGMPSMRGGAWPEEINGTMYDYVFWPMPMLNKEVFSLHTIIGYDEHLEVLSLGTDGLPSASPMTNTSDPTLEKKAHLVASYSADPPLNDQTFNLFGDNYPYEFEAKINAYDQFSNANDSFINKEFDIYRSYGYLQVTGSGDSAKSYMVPPSKMCLTFFVKYHDVTAYKGGKEVPSNLRVSGGGGDLIQYKAVNINTNFIAANGTLPVSNSEVVIKKVSADDPNVGLQGAEFQLIDNSSGTEVVVQPSLVTNESGLVTIQNLEAGKTYLLREVKAPAGFLLMSKDFVITAPQTGSETVIVKNQPKKALPETGTYGILPFAVVALLFLSLGAHIAAKQK